MRNVTIMMAWKSYKSLHEVFSALVTGNAVGRRI